MKYTFSSGWQSILQHSTQVIYNISNTVLRLSVATSPSFRLAKRLKGKNSIFRPSWSERGTWDLGDSFDIGGESRKALNVQQISPHSGHCSACVRLLHRHIKMQLKRDLMFCPFAKEADWDIRVVVVFDTKIQGKGNGMSKVDRLCCVYKKGRRNQSELPAGLSFCLLHSEAAHRKAEQMQI